MDADAKYRNAVQQLKATCGFDGRTVRQMQEMELALGSEVMNLALRNDERTTLPLTLEVLGSNAHETGLIPDQASIIALSFVEYNWLAANLKPGTVLTKKNWTRLIGLLMKGYPQYNPNPEPKCPEEKAALKDAVDAFRKKLINYFIDEEESFVMEVVPTKDCRKWEWTDHLDCHTNEHGEVVDAKRILFVRKKGVSYHVMDKFILCHVLCLSLSNGWLDTAIEAANSDPRRCRNQELYRRRVVGKLLDRLEQEARIHMGKGNRDHLISFVMDLFKQTPANPPLQPPQQLDPPTPPSNLQQPPHPSTPHPSTPAASAPQQSAPSTPYYAGMTEGISPTAKQQIMDLTSNLHDSMKEKIEYAKEAAKEAAKMRDRDRKEAQRITEQGTKKLLESHLEGSQRAQESYTEETRQVLVMQDGLIEHHRGLVVAVTTPGRPGAAPRPFPAATPVQLAGRFQDSATSLGVLPGAAAAASSAPATAPTQAVVGPPPPSSFAAPTRAFGSLAVEPVATASTDQVRPPPTVGVPAAASAAGVTQANAPPTASLFGSQGFGTAASFGHAPGSVVPGSGFTYNPNAEDQKPAATDGTPSYDPHAKHL